MPHAASKAPTSTLDPFEAALAVVLGTQVVLVSWLVGGMRPPGQVVGLALGAVALGLALLPRPKSPDHRPARRLIRFPIFWLGLFVLGWELVQTLNPAWRYVLDAQSRYWWMQRIDHLTWLPAGVDTPFARMNGWRTLMIHGMAWLAVCAAWAGLTRRRSCRWVLTAIAINGAALAMLGIAQRLSDRPQSLWFAARAANDFFATFVYRNHAGAFLNLALAASAALAFWHLVRAERHFKRSSPAIVFVFLAVVTAVGVLLSTSRGAITLTIVFALFTAALFFRRHFLAGARPGMLLLVLVIVGFAGYSAYSLVSPSTVRRFERWWDQGEDLGSWSARRQATQATWEMAQARIWTGWGAGSYRHLFPQYQQKYPEIYYVRPPTADRPGRGRLFWEYAHNDHVQLLAELGMIGCLPFVLGGLFWARRLWRARFWRSSWLLCLVVAGGLTLIHAWFDFPLHNPAILLAWCLLWPVGVRWREAEGAALR